MSYPSLDRHLATMGATLDTATDVQFQEAFLAAFREDLPLGMAHVDELVAKLSQTGDRAMLDLDPNSDEGRQFARLLGPDIPRAILEKHHGVSFGFYNCCKGVVAHSPDGLRLSFREQAAAQHPNFVNC